MPRRPPLPPGFAVIWTTVALDLVGFGIVLPILPLYAKRFHASSLTASLLVAAFSGASFAFSPIWGRVSDRVGRKPILVLSLVGTAVGSVITGLAGGLALLFIGRLIDGASGASISVAQASVADLAAPADRPRLFGLLGAAFGVGFVAGPAIGALAAVAGPRVPFLLAAAIAALNAAVAVKRLPETRPALPQPSPSRPHGRQEAVGREEREAAVVGLVGVAFLTLVAFSGFEATFAIYGQRHLGFGIGSSAAVFAVVGAVIVAVQVGLVGPVVNCVGERATLLVGLSLDAAGLVVLSRTRGWDLAVPALLALTVGQGLVQTTMSSALAGRAGRHRRGRVLGYQQSVGGMARVLGPALGGALLGRAASGSAYLAGAALVVAAVVLLAWTFRAAPPRAYVTMR